MRSSSSRMCASSILKVSGGSTVTRFANLTAASAVMFLAASTFAADPQVIELWPKAAPGEKGDIGPEHETQKPGDTITRLTDVTKPTLTVYPAPEGKATGAAVVVCPGGAYSILAIRHEGTEVAEWFNSIGVTPFVLK